MTNDLHRIHESSMAILAKTGIRLPHDQVLGRLKAQGVKVDGQTVFFKEQDIMRLLATAPSDVKVRGREPKYDLTLGGDVTHISPGYGAIAVEEDGFFRESAFADYIRFVKMYHSSDLYSFNGGWILTPLDLPPEQAFPVQFLSSLLLTDKCLIGGALGHKQTSMILTMLEIVFGGGEKAEGTMVSIVNSLSPLCVDTRSLETLFLLAKHNQPAAVSPAIMAGTTGPITLEGTIVLGNAESLAMIAAVQAVNPGAPVLYGAMNTMADMNTASWTLGNPGHPVCIDFAAQMARMYGVPSRGGGAGKDAAGVSVQSGYESMFNLINSYRSGVNLVMLASGNLDGHLVMSPDQMVIDLEILRLIQNSLRRPQFSDDNMALDVIAEVGIGGQYLNHRHTFKNARRCAYTPTVGVRNLGKREKYHSLLKERIEAGKERLLQSYTQPYLPEVTIRQLRAYADDQGLQWPDIT